MPKKKQKMNLRRGNPEGKEWGGKEKNHIFPDEKGAKDPRTKR